ncbi:PorT family protein [Bacteroidales bacterium OttesenSCG-928-I14]|nr:PorT family protein [Bacteroidales bacterium OttesenSCG-928-I14]
MKNFKLISLVCLLFASTIGLNAQDVASKSGGVGLKAGFNVSNLGDADYRPGFDLGLNAQFLLLGNFGVEGGFFYSMQGYKLADETHTASYLKMPIQAIYKFNVGKDLAIYPAAGVYLAYGLGGSKINDVKYFKKYKPFDTGAAFSLNLQFNKFEIGLNYDLGLLDISRAKSITAKNNNLKVSLGYFF